MARFSRYVRPCTRLRRFVVASSALLALAFVVPLTASAAGTTPVTISMRPSVSVSYKGGHVIYATDVAGPAGSSSQPTGSVSFSVVKANGKPASVQLCRALLDQGLSDSSGLCSATPSAKVVGDDVVQATYSGSTTYGGASTTSDMTFMSYPLPGLVLPPIDPPSAPNLPVRAPDPAWTLASGSTSSGGTAGVFVTANGAGQIQEYGTQFAANGASPEVTAGPNAASNSATAGDGSPSVEPYSSGSTNGYVLVWAQIINSYYCVSFAFDDATFTPGAKGEFSTSAGAPSICAKKGSYPFASTGPSTSLLDPYLFQDASGNTWLVYSVQWSGGTCNAVQCSELAAQRIEYPSADAVTLLGAPQALPSESAVETALNKDNPSAGTDNYQYGDHPLIENPAVVGPAKGIYDLTFSIGTWCGATTSPICTSTNGCTSASGTDCHPDTYNTAEVACTISDGSSPTWSCNTTPDVTDSPTMIMQTTGGASYLSYRMSPTTLMIWDEWIPSAGGGAPYGREGYESEVTYSQ